MYVYVDIYEYLYMYVYVCVYICIYSFKENLKGARFFSSIARYYLTSTPQFTGPKTLKLHKMTYLYVKF